MSEELLALMEPLGKTATKLNLSKVRENETLPITGTHFGGAPYAEDGDTWQTCTHCHKPLTFICQVNTAECFSSQPANIALFTFFYCWDCSPWEMDDANKGTWLVGTYDAPSKAKAVFIQPTSAQPHPTRPCRVELEKVLSFPDWESIDVVEPRASELSANLHLKEPWDQYDALLDRLDAFMDYATLVGGYPHWIQGEDTPLCDECGNRMKMLAQLDSEEEAGIMWVDTGCVYLFQCPQHPRALKLTLQCY